MRDFDEEIASGMHALVDDEPVSPPPTTQLLKRGKRARRYRAGAMTGGSFAVLAVVALTAVAVAGNPADKTTNPADKETTTAAKVAPQVELAAAITNSQNISFKVKLTSTTPGSSPIDIAFDPATSTGYMRSDGRMVVIQINGITYVAAWRKPGKYLLVPGRHDDGLGRFWPRHMTTDPEQLFKVLSQEHAKVTKTGPRTYHFEFEVVAPDSPHTKVFGDIEINADNRIAKITNNVTNDGVRESSQWEFSGYGEPVEVEPPSNVIKE